MAQSEIRPSTSHHFAKVHIRKFSWVNSSFIPKTEEATLLVGNYFVGKFEKTVLYENTVCHSLSSPMVGSPSTVWSHLILTWSFISPSPTYLDVYWEVDMLRQIKPTNNLILALHDNSIRINKNLSKWLPLRKENVMWETGRKLSLFILYIAFIVLFF